jgi:hypothetical protein
VFLSNPCNSLGCQLLPSGLITRDSRAKSVGTVALFRFPETLVRMFKAFLDRSFLKLQILNSFKKATPANSRCNLKSGETLDRAAPKKDRRRRDDEIGRRTNAFIRQLTSFHNVRLYVKLRTDTDGQWDTPVRARPYGCRCRRVW